ncbi:MAG TPA: glycine oxidase ThiO [Solirubrobacteraceae bacterium]|nr:glycine oxidase ThiO [Solirubrobacteraceae bacterium]
MTSHSTEHTTDVAVVGGGLVGLATAWRAAQRGLSVTVLDRGALGEGASRAAAGMLAPVSEAEADELPLLRAGLASVARWPAFAAELHEASGLDPGHLRCGTLIVARDADEAAWLERELALRERLGLRAQRLLGSEARRREGGLAPGVRLGLDVPDDHAVDPRAVVASLAAACERAGVVLRPGEEVVEHDATSVTTAAGERIAAGRVVLAAGAWSGAPVRPVKGQILRLRDPQGPGLFERVIRYERGYLVPRGDGRYVLGATVEERGFDTTVTAGGVRELLAEAQLIVPGIDDMVLEEAMAGLRPGTPDNAPLVGFDARGVLLATGLYRNGVLLCPLIAEAVVALLCDEQPPEEALAFAPGRFAETSA